MNHFNLTDVVPRSGKGIVFADGTYMLQRQGFGSTLNCTFGHGHLEVHIDSSFATGELFYQSGSLAPQHTARNHYSYHSYGTSAEHILPVALQENALEWFEQRSGQRPAGIRQQALAYMYSSSNGNTGADDILLMRYRYDSADQALYDIEGDEPIAEFVSDGGKTFVMDTVRINTLALDADTEAAFEKALHSGFHPCDTHLGADHCMRRLAWLASEYFLAANEGKQTTTYVLKRDAERPAELTDMIVR
jgi:hypothetical protein